MAKLEMVSVTKEAMAKTEPFGLLVCLLDRKGGTELFCSDYNEMKDSFMLIWRVANSKEFTAWVATVIESPRFHPYKNMKTYVTKLHGQRGALMAFLQKDNFRVLVRLIWAFVAKVDVDKHLLEATDTGFEKDEFRAHMVTSLTFTVPSLDEVHLQTTAVYDEIGHENKLKQPVEPKKRSRKEESAPPRINEEPAPKKTNEEPVPKRKRARLIESSEDEADTPVKKSGSSEDKSAPIVVGEDEDTESDDEPTLKPKKALPKKVPAQEVSSKKVSVQKVPPKKVPVQKVPPKNVLNNDTDGEEEDKYEYEDEGEGDDEGEDEDEDEESEEEGEDEGEEEGEDEGEESEDEESEDEPKSGKKRKYTESNSEPKGSKRGRASGFLPSNRTPEGQAASIRDELFKTQQKLRGMEGALEGLKKDLVDTNDACAQMMEAQLENTSKIEEVEDGVNKTTQKMEKVTRTVAAHSSLWGVFVGNEAVTRVTKSVSSGAVLGVQVIAGLVSGIVWNAASTLTTNEPTNVIAALLPPPTGALIVPPKPVLPPPAGALTVSPTPVPPPPAGTPAAGTPVSLTPAAGAPAAGAAPSRVVSVEEQEAIDDLVRIRARKQVLLKRIAESRKALGID
jgi:hypothetical protein